MENSESTLSAVSPSTASGNGAAAEAQSGKVATSRANGASGPRTTQGKQRSRCNATKHSIFSQVALLKDESRAEYDALLNGLRENLQPEGELEEQLVEKLALFTWRHRRMIIAETAEIRKATEFLLWDADQQQAERTNKISDYSIRYEGGLIREIANAQVLDTCLDLLKELGDRIEDDGFAPKSDAQILTKLYGEPSQEKWQKTLFDSYRDWSRTAECSEEERQQHAYATPEKCKKSFLEELDGEIKRLERYKKTRASMESERMKLEALRQHVPLTPQFDHLLRYEASLERNFDRTLSQLERVQRMRLGQPVLPKLEVHHSVS
jgi:hypothetical protein